MKNNVITETVEQIEELITFSNEKLHEPKKTQALKTLEELKTYLLDRKKPLEMKHEIILRLPLLHIAIRKAS